MKYNLLIIAVLAMLISSCSGGSQNITTPAQDSPINDFGQTGVIKPSLGVSDYFPDGSPATGMGSLGLFNLHIDPISVSAELTSVRSASLPDVLEVVDITNFLQLAPCTDCAKIQSVSLDDDGNVVVSIGLKHPFEEGDPFKPITGRNRGDLHVFNVEGTIFSNNTASSFPGLGRSVANFRLLNASGYTGYLNPVIDTIYPTSATIHPYILHFDDYSQGNFDPMNPMGFSSVTDPHPSGNLVMAMGSDYDFKDYIFALPDEPVDFIYAVGCTYAVSSATKSERFNPEFRVPQHLKKAASEVWVEIIENNLAAFDTDSTADITINVVDRSHGVDVGDGLDQMLAQSDVGAIRLEIPGLLTEVLNVDITSPIGTGHDPEDPLVYPATITNTTGADTGTFHGLIKVVDTYPPGLNESPLLDGMDGIERVDPVVNPLEGLYAIPEFATYCHFAIAVEFSNEPPVAILKPDPAFCYLNRSVDFDATESYDPDGEIVLYEFDFDWDGVEDNFTVEESNTTGLATSPVYTVEGFYTVGLRVTDNHSAVAYDSAQLEVSECQDTISEWDDESLPLMNRGRNYGRALRIDNEVWIVGGRYQQSIEVFDLETETWDTTPRASMPDERNGFAGAYHDGRIYVIGGYHQPTLTRLDTTMFYDIETDTWDTTTVPPFPDYPKNVLSAVTYNDEIYVHGGWNPALRDLDPPEPMRRVNMDIYNPATNEWREAAPGFVGRTHPFMVVVNDKIYVSSCNSHSSGCENIDVYDPATDSWETFYSIPMERYRNGMAAINYGNTLYIAGGHQSTTTVFDWVDAFDLETKTLTPLESLPNNRSFGHSLVFEDCKLYVFIGSVVSGATYRETWYGQL